MQYPCYVCQILNLFFSTCMRFCNVNLLVKRFVPAVPRRRLHLLFADFGGLATLTSKENPKSSHIFPQIILYYAWSSYLQDTESLQWVNIKPYNILGWCVYPPNISQGFYRVRAAPHLIREVRMMRAVPSSRFYGFNPITKNLGLGTSRSGLHIHMSH